MMMMIIINDKIIIANKTLHFITHRWIFTDMLSRYCCDNNCFEG